MSCYNPRKLWRWLCKLYLIPFWDYTSNKLVVWNFFPFVTEIKQTTPPPLLYLGLEASMSGWGYLIFSLFLEPLVMLVLFVTLRLVSPTAVVSVAILTWWPIIVRTELSGIFKASICIFLLDSTHLADARTDISAISTIVFASPPSNWLTDSSETSTSPFKPLDNDASKKEACDTALCWKRRNWSIALREEFSFFSEDKRSLGPLSQPIPLVSIYVRRHARINFWHFAKFVKIVIGSRTLISMPLFKRHQLWEWFWHIFPRINNNALCWKTWTFFLLIGSPTNDWAR